MAKPIRVSYRWSVDEVLMLNNLHMRYSPQLRKLARSSRVTAGIFLAIGALCFCAIGATPQKGRAFAYGCIFILLGTVIWSKMPMRILMRRVVLRAYTKKPDRDLPITYDISEERLACESEVASSDMLWRAILRVLRTSHGFLIYISDTQIHWLPVHGFENSSEVERLASLAKENVKDYEDER